jgi:hypothetical protein
VEYLNMRAGIAAAFGLAVLLGGCTATTPAYLEAQNRAPVGYRYYDNQHPNWINNPSPEAIANAQRGTYLWPPAMGTIR